MSSPKPLPSLFGRFTAIFQDHEDLSETLRRLRKMCAALDDGRAPLLPELEPSLLVVDLRLHLGAHFSAEESEEYFGTVMEEAPSLAPQIAALKWEHLTMLQAADMLCGLARDQSRWSQLSVPTLELIKQLERHERAESILLRHLFSPVR